MTYNFFCEDCQHQWEDLLATETCPNCGSDELSIIWGSLGVIEEN